ncbi:hypothetical protein TNCV_2038601 [Trichonephila clavipes]|nr:hypothetical protein TNCV_2038601 [Trichonephila clavipes]
MFNFYRCFIPKAAHILALIVPFLEVYTNQKKSHSSVRKSSEPLKWNENAEQAFLAAKNAIAEATLLRHPIPGAQLSLWVDASDIAIGGTLSQLSQGKWEPIAFFSIKLNKNIVSPLPPSEGHNYLLTIIDRFSRWLEAISIPDMQAKTICRAIFDTGISRFSCPSVITSDQGTQMRSSMYTEFTRMLGTAKIKTTTYHPKSNGIVERFHRHLKSSIKAHENDTWSEIVPIILLGIRTAVKEDLQSSCAEIVYGTKQRLPSDIIDVSNIPFCDNNFITNLCNRMQQLNSAATSAHCTDQYYIHPSLQSSSHIFLRIDRVQPPLRQPYTGPHKVLSRTDKTIITDVNGRKTTVSL